MAIVKLNLSEDVLKLVSCIRFKELPHFEENDQREHVGYEIDMQSIYGGDFLLEDMSYILGLYDQHIPDTEEDADGPKFPREIEEKMIQLHLFILDNLDSIEEIVHQHVLKGGVTPGEYKCKDWQRIWEKVNPKTIKDCDKLIVIHYVNVGSIDESDIPEYLETFSKNLDYDETVRCYIIPVKNQDSRVEVFNSREMKEEEYKQTIEKYEKMLQDWLNSKKIN